MTGKILTIPVINRKELAERHELSWFRGQTGWTPTCLMIAVAGDLSRLAIDYRYRKNPGGAAKEIELTGGSFKMFVSNGLISRAELKAFRPRKSDEAYAELAELLRTMVSYLRSLPAECVNRRETIKSAEIIADHWKLEDPILKLSLKPPFMNPM